MSYPFDPPEIGRRTGGSPDRGGTLNSRQAEKSQREQYIKPVCFDGCWRTTMIDGLSYNGGNGTSAIKWADPADHNKVFDVDLRDGTLKYVQPAIQHLSYTLGAALHAVLGNGMRGNFIMYYKDGSEIDFDAVVLTGNTFFESSPGSWLLVHQPLIARATQAWEVAGSEPKVLRPSGFAIRCIAGAGSSIDVNIPQLFIASLNQ